MIGIYKFTNKFNRKVYIGQAVNIERRRKAHLYEALKNKDNNKNYFHNAIRKHGLENFDFEVLIECPKENLNYWEAFYIKYYCANIHNYGYNETEGGFSTVFSEDVLKRMSESAIKRGNNLPSGFKHSEESRRKNSDSHKGKTPWNKGLKTGPNFKLRESKQRNKYIPSEEHKNKTRCSMLGKNKGKHRVYREDGSYYMSR